MLQQVANKLKFRISRAGRSRGFSLIETFVATAAFSGVAIFTVSVLVMTGKQSQRTLKSLPASTNTFRMMDRLRYEVLSSQAGRVNKVDDDTLEFYDAARDRVSRVYFHPGNNGKKKGLYYIPDVASENAEYALGSGESLTNVDFELDNLGRNVVVILRHKAKNSKGVDTVYSIEEQLTFRN